MLNWQTSKTFLANAAVFCLPLGFFGNAGILLSILLLILSVNTLTTLDYQLIFAAVPLSIVIIFSTILSPIDTQLQSLGTAFLYLITPLAALNLAKFKRTTNLNFYFYLGSSILALSVILDFTLGINTLPSGLFRDPSLHNWTATLLFFSLILSTGIRNNYLKSLSLLIFFTSLLMTLSWTVLISLFITTIYYFWINKRKKILLTLVLLTCFITGTLWQTPQGLAQIKLKEKNIITVQKVIKERLAIFKTGIHLSSKHPYLGWGIQNHQNLSHEELITAQTTNYNPNNYLYSTEALNKLPWGTFESKVTANQAIAPDGSYTADLIEGNSHSGNRIYQLVNTPKNAPYLTFSFWAKTKSHDQTLAISIKDSNQETQSITLLNTPKSSLPVQELKVTRSWKRYSINFKLSPNYSGQLYIFIFLDGYFKQVPQQNKSFYIWGTQLKQTDSLAHYYPVNKQASVIDLNVINHFHNWFIQILFSYGLLGLFSLAGLLLFIWLQLTSSLSKYIFIGGITTQFFDYSFAQSSILMLFFAIVFLSNFEVISGEL